MCPQSVSSATETSPKSHGAKRGRPKTDTLPEKIREGEEKEGEYQCSECRRLFPRRKSLTAHERTHTNERPYPCDYPGCIRAFRQSGQLKTHQRRHTGEKPFVCSYPGCQERYVHSNRHCHKHPQQNLIRDGNAKIWQGTESMSFEELEWLEKYRAEKENPAKRKRMDSGSSSEDSDKEILERIKLARLDLEEKELLESIEAARKNLKTNEIISAYVLLTMGKRLLFRKMYN